MSQNDSSISSLKEEFASNEDLTKSDDISPILNETPTTSSFDKFKNKKLILLSVFSALFLFSAVGYFIYSSYFAKNSTSVKDPIAKNGDVVNDNSYNPGANDSVNTTDYPNPINGVYLTKANYEDVINRKPIAIMINNHVDARPQAGISQADVVYEIVAEGGISRFMGVFHSQIPERVGPIRSARKYFMQVAAEYWPIFSHWGIAYRPDYELNLPAAEFDALLAQGAAETDPRADARSYIDEIGLPVANTDTTPSVFYRENIPNVAIEHTGYAHFNEIYNEFKKYYPEESWSEYQPFDVWEFKDDSEVYIGEKTVNKISYNFWDMPGFETEWNYDINSNSYLRAQGSTNTIDRNTNESPKIKNVVIQYTPEEKLGDKKSHLLYDVIGTGTAEYFIDGKVIEGTWSKSDARSRTVYEDSTGNPIKFNRGQFWIVILPDYSTVTYE